MFIILNDIDLNVNASNKQHGGKVHRDMNLDGIFTRSNLLASQDLIT